MASITESVNANDPPYGPRVLMMLDILGFADMVHEFETDANKFNVIYEVLRGLAPEQAHTVVFDTYLGRQVSGFSDHVVISHQPTLEGVSATIAEAGVHAFRLLAKGVAARGAITLGPLLHEGPTIVGSALVEAHRLEQHCAIYPRVIVHPRVVDFIRRTAAKPPAGAPVDLLTVYGRIHIRLDSDGRWYVPIFDPNWIRNAWHFYSAHNVIVGQIRSVIQEMLDKTKSDPRKFSKWVWLADLYNKSVSKPEFDIDSALSKNPIPIP